MNKKTIQYMLSFLTLIISLSTVYTVSLANTNSYYNNSIKVLNDSTANSDIKNNSVHKHSRFDIFSKENFKYLSDDQKKELLELKKYKDKDEKLSKEQVETLHSIIECIIKGKLGDENYKNFKALTEKKKNNEKLTDEEYENLKEYRDIIDGNKLSTKEILSQFLR